MAPTPPRDNSDKAPADQAGVWLQRVAGQQDKAAFASLFHHFAPRLKAYLMRQNLTRQEAEDLAQDIMLQLWSKAAAYDPKKARASTWIYTIARNRLIDYLRQKKHFVPLEEGGLDRLESTESPSAAAEASADAATLRTAINELPKAQREMVEESFFKEHTHRMIAEARRIPLGTVKSRLRLALDRLRGSLIKNGADKITPPASAVAPSQSRLREAQSSRDKNGAEQDANKNPLLAENRKTIKDGVKT
jgi:RNA polymerase sigma-70 factor (ECF subfamily)